MRATFDLEHLLALSDVPGLPLLVSERTLYLLENLAITDITDASRFSLGPVEAGFYMAVDDEDVAEYAFFLDVMHQAQLEILEVEQMFYGIESTGYLQDLYDVPGAGNYVRDLLEVPEGELWEIQLLGGAIFSGTATQVVFSLYVDAQATWINYVASPPSNVVIPWAGRIVLSGGQAIKISYTGVSAGSALLSTAYYAKLLS